MSGRPARSGSGLQASPEEGARPLHGCVVALTRPRDRLGPLTRTLTEAGAEVVLLPIFRTEPVEGSARAALREALERFAFSSSPGWIALTSASVVLPLADAIRRAPRAHSALAGPLRIAVVGRATGRAARSKGLPVTLEGTGEGARFLADRILAADPAPRVLHPTSDRGLPQLKEALEAAGGRVESVIAVVHRPEPGLDPDRLFRAPPVRQVVFASPSAAEGLLSSLAEERREALLSIPAVAVGPTTAEALRGYGFREVAVADRPTPDSIRDALVALRHSDPR